MHVKWIISQITQAVVPNGTNLGSYCVSSLVSFAPCVELINSSRGGKAVEIV